MKYVLHIIFLFSFTYLTTACVDDEEMEVNPNAFEFQSDLSDLEIQTDGKNCELEEVVNTCEKITVEEPVAFKEEDFDFLIWQDKGVGDEVIYRNAQGEEFAILISLKNRYLYDHVRQVYCNETIEQNSIVCQKSEKIDIEFSSEFFNNALLRFELETEIISLRDGILGEPQTSMYLSQKLDPVNTYVFSYHFIVDYVISPLDAFYKESITLNEQTFENVLDIEVEDSPSSGTILNIYYNKADGLIGFRKDGKVWLRVAS